jgi:hypothetical protein
MELSSSESSQQARNQAPASRIFPWGCRRKCRSSDPADRHRWQCLALSLAVPRVYRYCQQQCQRCFRRCPNWVLVVVEADCSGQPVTDYLTSAVYRQCSQAVSGSGSPPSEGVSSGLQNPPQRGTAVCQGWTKAVTGLAVDLRHDDRTTHSLKTDEGGDRVSVGLGA